MIELRHLTKYYYSGESVVMALDHVNLRLDAGDFVAITGESGSGKSTLLKVISGIETYEDGELYFNGVDTSAFGAEDWESLRREQLAVVYQDYQLLEKYSVLENVEMVLLICEKRLGVLTAKERRKRAMEYLDIVGLTGQAGQKAGNISSGQKQRLGIARALAKQTGVIIADEPTGNLDTESGGQIMELFGKLAKNHLVIVVTHNMEQAEPYITRRVRLFDGFVTEDVRLKENLAVPPEKEVQKRLSEEPAAGKEEGAQEDTRNEIKKRTKKKHRVRSLAWMELKGTPFLSMLLFVFFLFSAGAILLALGIFAENQDDLTVRAITGNAFANRNRTRVVIRTKDGSDADKEDLEKLKSISHVYSVDAYDTVNEINYMYKKDRDYEVEIQLNDSTGYAKKKVTMTNFSYYMRSEFCISEDDLKKGHLPEAYGEIVVGAWDEELYGTTIPVYFTSQKLWGGDVYTCFDMKVVGVCENIPNQIYFDEEFCRIMSVRTNDIEISTIYYVEKEVAYQDHSQEDYSFVSKKTYNAALICNPLLGEEEVCMPDEIISNLGRTEKGQVVTQETLLPDVELQMLNSDSTGAEDLIKEVYSARVRENGSQSSNRILEVGQTLFHRIFGEPNFSQASIYLDHYANMDSVLTALERQGYDLVSVIRVSAGDYDGNKVKNQMISLSISSGAAVLFLLADLIVLVMMMRTKKRDYRIMGALGLERRTITEVIVLQILQLGGAAFAVIPIAFVAAAAWGAERFYSMMFYFRFQHVAVYVLYGCLLIILCSILSNRTGKKRR